MNETTRALIELATRLRLERLDAPALELLDEAMRAHGGEDLDFTETDGNHIADGSEFGDIVRAAFPGAQDQDAAVRAFNQRYKVSSNHDGEAPPLNALHSVADRRAEDADAGHETETARPRSSDSGA